MAELGLSLSQLLLNFLRHLVAFLVKAREEGLAFCWGKIFHEKIIPASVLQVTAPRVWVPASGSQVPVPESGTFLRLPGQVISPALR